MIKLKNILSELDDVNSHEGKMAKAQSYELMKDAEDVCRMISDGDNLPEWLEAKITLASDYMNKVKDYLSNYEMKNMQENVLKEASFSINALIKMHSKIRKDRAAAYYNWTVLDQKWSNSKVALKKKEQDLQDQRDRVMKEMENDPDVLRKPTVGNKGPVADYGKQLNKIEFKQRRLEAAMNQKEREVEQARKDYEDLKRKELKINDSTMQALGKGRG